jgi:alginate O-acetyltransferase complex protein AlgI
MPQLTGGHSFDPDGFSRGLQLILWGFMKKLIIADRIATPVGVIFSSPENYSGVMAFLGAAFYGIQVYADFSGGMDIALGAAQTFGISLAQNFTQPYFSTSVEDFWRRWHITLSRFFGTYVYIPLGGNRKGIAIQCRNLFIVFLLSGIWHGAGWTFIVWGIMHGICVIFETLVPPMKAEDPRSPRCRILTLLRKVRTFLLVTLSFSIFRAESLGDAGILWKRLFAGGWNGMLLGISGSISLPEFYVIQKLIAMKAPGLAVPFCMAVIVGLLLLSLLLITGPKAESWIQKHGTKIGSALLLAVLFLWSFASLSQVSTFLYFDF